MLRRRLMWYEEEMILNLERLGFAQDGNTTDKSPPAEPTSLAAAKKDLHAALHRLQLYKKRIDGLTGVFSDLVNIRNALRSLKISDFAMKLSLLGIIILPITLVAAIFSMGDTFRPGAQHFWIPWVVALPLVAIMAVILFADRFKYTPQQTTQTCSAAKVMNRRDLPC
jgi:Mg2+ and Co2+ transporter CorA